MGVLREPCTGYLRSGGSTVTDAFDPREYLAERTRIHEEASGDYEWFAAPEDDAEEVHIWYRRKLGDGTYEAVGKVIDNPYDCPTLEDIDAIVDAHNTQPLFIEALEKVLELHSDPALANPLLCGACLEVRPCTTTDTITDALQGKP